MVAFAVEKRLCDPSSALRREQAETDSSMDLTLKNALRCPRCAGPLRADFACHGCGPYPIVQGQPVLIVDDIVSTGTSIKECLAAVRKAGGKPVAVAALIDRTAGKVKFGVPFVTLAEWKVPAWQADRLPAHLKNIPAVKPGSRGLA